MISISDRNSQFVEILVNSYSKSDAVRSVETFDFIFYNTIVGRL